MNKFIGIGRLTNNVELKETSNGKYYVKNSLAIKNDFKKRLILIKTNKKIKIINTMVGMGFEPT